jgi:hypothetical protein
MKLSSDEQFEGGYYGDEFFGMDLSFTDTNNDGLGVVPMVTNDDADMGEFFLDSPRVEPTFPAVERPFASAIVADPSHPPRAMPVQANAVPEGMRHGDAITLVNGTVKLSAFYKWLLFMHYHQNKIEFCLSPRTPKNKGHQTNRHAEFMTESGRSIWLYFCPPQERKCDHALRRYTRLSDHKAPQHVIDKKAGEKKEPFFSDESNPFRLRCFVEAEVSAEDIRRQWQLIKQQGHGAAVELAEDWVSFLCLCSCLKHFSEC